MPGSVLGRASPSRRGQHRFLTMDNDAPQDREMSILEHLEELRRRLIIAGLAILVGMAIAAAFLGWRVWDLLAMPLPEGMKPQSLRPAETFIAYFKVSLVTGAALAMPVLVQQVILFVLPALHPHERKYLFIAVPAVTVSFLVGLAFGFFVVIPFAVRYLAGFGADLATAAWSLDAYLSFVSTLLFWIGVSFETPFFIFFLAKLGVVNAHQLGRYRRYALVGAFVIAAVITPTPDPLNQSIVAIPIYLLYELGVLLARFA
jgi:sec-independent protein translocase protein TatC